MSASEYEPPVPARPGRRMLGRFAIAALVLVLMTGGATATAVLLEVQDVGAAFREGAPEIKAAPVTAVDPGKPQTIMLVGSDRRFRDRKDKRNARSDTIILVRLNPDAAATTVMSIPRDLKVRLRPGAPPDKINAAFSKGGPAATGRIVKRTLSFRGRPFQINHIVNINFGGFREVVNRLGCVYADIDRNYFNDNRPPAGGGEPYAVIDVKPGYQKVCGQDALDYVRFRHLDTDIVRGARQQSFLASLRHQYSAGRIFSDRKRLLRIAGRYTQTDRAVHQTNGILKLLDLVIFSARKPVTEIHFPAELGDAQDPFVHVNPFRLRAAVTRFLHPGPARRPAAPRRRVPAPRPHRPRPKPGPVPGMVDASYAGAQQARLIGGGFKLPVYYPKQITAKGRYLGPLGKVYPRRYAIKVRGHYFGAYRFSIDAGGIGQFYGVQGTLWRNPPILNDPSEVRRVNGKRLLLFYDGRRLQTVGWKTPTGAYWIQNTLLESVGNRQMLAMAGSLTRSRR